MTSDPSVGPAGDSARTPPQSRLDSWKEIAAYFRRDVRTVRRWEASEGLPVHRHRHGERHSVYAYPDELDRWWANGRTAHEGQVPRVRPVSTRVLWTTAAVLALVLAAIAVTRLRVPGEGVGAAAGRSPAGSPAPGAGMPASERLRDLPPDVRELFLLARYHLSRRAGQRHKAREYLEQVTARAPAFAEGHAALGEVYMRDAFYRSEGRAQAWASAEAAATRALALDPTLAAAHTTRARILLMRDWDWDGARAEFLRAIELDPVGPEPRSGYALYLRSTGRSSEAIAERRKACEGAPLDPQLLVFLGDEYVFARRYVEGAETYQRALELDRNHRPAIAGLADAYALLGRDSDAATARIRALTLSEETHLAAGFTRVYRRQGFKAAARWLDEERLRQFLQAREDHLWDLAYTYARLAQPEAALRYLSLAYDRRAFGLLLARVDPDVDSLRDDPRFQDLLRRIGPPSPGT